MRTSHRRGATRLAVSLVIATTMAGAAALAVPSTAQAAGHCVDANNAPATCPTIVSVSVGSAWIRSSTTTPITYGVTVVVDDPANIAVEADTTMGRGLNQPTPTVVVGYGYTPSPSSTSGTRKTFTMTVQSPYRTLYPQGGPPAYGGFQINPVIWGVDPGAPPNDPNGQFLTETYRSGTIKARSVVTNTPSATSVRKGQWFTERGKLTRFDGSPQPGQKVNVYYVPAGQTKASYAGSATTSWTGAWSLPVRSWYTGSWFVSYPGSAFSTSVYKGVWVRVS